MNQTLLKNRLKKELKEWLPVIIIVLLLKATLVEGMVVPSGSMEETLLIGDAMLVNKFIYGNRIPWTSIPFVPGRMPKPGEMAAFLSPLENKNIVKRCIAVEGDTVEIINKEIYINHRKVPEPYVKITDTLTFKGVNLETQYYQRYWEKGQLFKSLENPLRLRDNFGPVIIPRDYLFVLGDNRDNSFDSRFWGPLHKKYLLGKPIVIYMSIDIGSAAENILEILRVWRWRGVRFDRIGKIL